MKSHLYEGTRPSAWGKHIYISDISLWMCFQVHTPIAKETYTPGERVSQIKTFQFLDDKEFAKVYLPLEDLNKITVENIETSFQPTAFTLTIRGLKATPLQFTVSKLHKEINPEECSVKVMKTKLLIKLKKVLEGTDTPCPGRYTRFGLAACHSNE